MLYLDHRAGSPIRPEALEVLRRVALGPGALGPAIGPGNPSSIHQEGQRARRRIDEASRWVLAYLGRPGWDVLWTGSLVEARALTAGLAVYDTGASGGWPAPSDPVDEADALVVLPASFGGPSGLACVVTRKGTTLRPLWGGGGQQRGVRSGSLPVALIVAAGEASRVAHLHREVEKSRARELRSQLVEVGQGLVRAGLVTALGRRGSAVVELELVSGAGCESECLHAELDAVGLCVAVETGGPPAVGSGEPARGVRLVLSLGWSTTADELAPLANMLHTALERARSRVPVARK